MSHHLPNLFVVVAMLAGLLVPTVTVGATPVVSAPSPQEGVEVHVPNFVFDPLLGSEPKLSGAQRVDSQEVGLRLVQFSGPTRDAWLAGLEAAGLQVLQYYPDYTYLVWGEQSALSAASSLEFVRWTGDFQPAYKVNSDLVGREGLVQNVAVLFYNDGNIEGTLDALQVLGANVIQAHPAQPDTAFYEAIVALDAAAFDAVSRLGTVVWLGYSHPVPVLDDEMSDQILAGNYSVSGVPFTGYEAHLAGLGINGAGVRWATIDTGVDYNHPDLGPHIVAGYDFPGACSFAGQPGSDCASGGHGTHVTGIIGGSAAGGFADANGFKYGLGMAPAYDIVAMNSLSASAWPPAGGWQEHSKRAVLMSAVGGNNSWTTGEGTAHGYQASERTHDLMVLDGNFDTTAVEPFIEVFSAGNSGPGAQTLTAPKEAKNLIIVASSLNYRAGSINSISSFSSRGPAVDGRIVPTITTPGEQIASTRNDLGGDCSTAIAGTNNLYAFCSGTSMASPHASGAVVLATQWWRGFNAGANPSPAMAKALLVNSAVDMGTADIPNFNEGWGRINITKMIQPSVLVEYWDQEHIFTESGQQWTISVGVQDPTKPLKVTLAWADAAGAVGANPALVNNLNLTVTNGANTYKGNVFSGGWSVTGGSADALNNLENVYVQNPAGGATIVIDAVNIAGDAVLGNADPTDQGFALICQNCALFPDYTLAATPSSLDVCAPANAVYNVAVGSILGYADPVVLSVSGNPAGTTAGFAPNPVTPPGASTLTIGNTGAAAAGSYNLTVSGASTSGSKSVDVGLNLFTAAPAAATLTAPANGATNVPATPTFTWSAVAQAATYSIEVATDAGFANIVASASGLTGTSWTSNVALNTSTTHYWRVQAANACGVGAYSSVFSFTTVAAPGDCGPGTVPNVLYTYGFEAGASGWTTPAGVGTNTWAILTTNPHSGASHYRGLDPSAVSDQRLVSPAVTLPTGQDPVVLKFWHVPNLESSSSGCFDGGILEVSVDAGATWTQVSNADLLVGPYTGAISGSYSNPLGGLQGWCGASAYFNTIANLSAYAGQTVQFRYRLGSDTSVSDVGWDVDDVMVQSCEPSGSYAAISLVKTVGTTAGVCAATSNITVAPGTTVYYCYTVTNTGNVPLNLHTLNDDVLGTIFSGFNYALVPGASVNTVAAGLSIPYVANATTTNTATWTAYEPQGPSAQATASATVTVATAEPNINVDPLSLAATQPTNTTTQQTLNVGNTGTADLTWTIVEEPTATAPEAVAPDPNADPSQASEEANAAAAAPEGGAPVAPSAWRWPTAVLYDNGPLVTHPGGGAGGADASAVQTALGNTLYGSNGSLSGGYRMADDFTVPAGGWQIDTITVFAYQTGSTTASTINNVNLRIWDGVPGAAGSNIVFGDTTTNRLANTGWSNIYRVLDTALTNTDRPIMSNVVTVNTYLPAGTYWADWQIGGTLSSGPWVPPVTLLGQTGKPGANALQYVASSATWNAVVDGGSGAAQDLPFAIQGGGVSAECTNPSDVSWLSEVPVSGTTAAGGVTPVTVSFDSTGLAVGVYTANLCVTSDDPDAGPGNGTELVVVPVTLTVEEPPQDPNINVDPLSLTSTQSVNTTTSQTLTVGNTGGSDLIWSIAEEPAAAPVQLPIGDAPVDLQAEIAGIETAHPAVLPQRDPAAHANAVRMMFTTGVLLVPDSTNDRVMALDPTTGDVVDADFIPSNSVMGTAVNAILGADGESILVSDQINDVVHKFDLDGNYLGVFAPAGGVNNAILNNIRGISLDASGNLLVTNSDATNNDAVAKFDTAGNYLGNFIANGAGGLDSPFDIYGRAADWLSGGSSSSAIHRYDLTGAYIANLATISTFPEQIAEAANSNVLVANFSPSSNEGVIELTADGTLVGRYDPTGLGGYRGVYELPGGTILTTTGSGVHEIDRSGALVENKITGVSGRFIEYAAPQTICTNPADVPWLSEAPTAGTTAAGGSTAVQVTFDSTGLAVGAYTANLCVASNDPDAGPGNGTELVVVPVTLNVTEAPAASISLVKTVGTVPGVCATADDITVDQGTEVYYCYQATNTGSVTFNFHDLEDSVLGTLLADFPYTLAPGASSPEVIVADTPMATVTNVATWTAFTSLAGYAADINAPYSYIPINATGAALGLTDDGEANITLPFDFTFFGVTSNALRVGNNGGILFNVTAGDLSLSNGALPRATPALAILPFWDDMDSDTGDVYWEVQGTAPNRVAIIEWYNRPHYSNTGAATYEVLLYEGTNELKFQYADVDFGNTSYNNGASATVGINKDATTALQVSYNQAVIQNEQAIAISLTPVESATATDSATVNVLIPHIDVDPLSLSSTQAPDIVLNQTLNITDIGGAPLIWEIAETQPDRETLPGIVAAPEPVFNVPEAVTSKADCAAFENYPGREPAGWAEFCADGLEVAPAFAPSLPTSNGYAQDVGYVSDNFVRFPLNNFPGQTVMGTNTNAYYGMDFDSTGTTLYALNDTNDTLGTIDLNTGAYTPIVACPPAGGAANWTGMAIDPTTDVMYASTAANLYTLDPATCSPVLVGSFGTTTMIAIAVNAAGAMYGHDITSDSIYTIDTATGAATLVGPTGYAANFAQGMDFDNEDGTLYIWLYIGSGVNHYGTVNLATGAVTPLASSSPTGEFEGATQTLGLCIPTDYGWLSVNPTSGTTAPGATTPLTVAFDSTGLAVGTYTGQLCVRSNDPDPGPGNHTALVPVPVTLVVEEAAPSITLAKTVGTEAGVCAATDNITVLAGTTVYYCYTVTNNGNVAFNLHDLVDDQLGTIFSGLNYMLAPGASVNTVDAGLTISAVINATTTNVATWTAYNTNGASATAAATATVTVTGGQVYGYVFDDLNVDGWRNAGETTGQAGVPVILTRDGVQIAYYWSNAPSGWYDFGILNPGNYCIEILVPAGYVPTSPTKVCFTLGGTDKNVNFGLDKARANIGDLVFFDANSNGIFDLGEYGIGNVTVALWTSSGGAPGAVIATTTTAADGAYLFSNVLPGAYFVQVTDVNGELTDLTLTTAGNPLGPITVVHMQEYLDADFGYNLVCSSTRGAISGRVWNDVNADGVQDAGEAGIAGVTACAEPVSYLNTRCRTTNSAGYFYMCVPRGTYLVAPLTDEEPLASMTPTTPEFYLPVVIRPGGSFTTAFFGYQ